MARESRREPAQFIANGAALPVLIGTVFVIIAGTEVSKNHGIAANGWFIAGILLIIVGVLLSISGAIMFYFPAAFEPIVVDMSPRQLVDLFDGLTDEQGKQLASRYIGKRMRASGPLENISKFMSRSVSVDLGGYGILSHNSVYFYCSGRGNVARIRLKNIGDPITLIGKITEIRRHSVTLEHCKLDISASNGNMSDVRPKDAVRTSQSIGPSKPSTVDQTLPETDLERDLLDVTPDQIMKLLEDVTSIQGQDRVARYLGGWINIKGALRDVRSDGDGIHVTFLDDSFPSAGAVLCIVSDKNLTGALRLKNIADEVALVGRIDRADSGGIVLRDCEFQEHTK